MKPVQPVACNYYGIRKPRLHPPIINHEFGEQMVQYCLIKILNEDNHETTLNKDNIYSQSFFTFKVTLKINKINSYSDTCNIRDCNICKMDQENERVILYVHQLLVSCKSCIIIMLYMYLYTIREYELKTPILI